MRCGRRRMAEYCESKDIPFVRVGKVIVATEAEDLPGWTCYLNARSQMAYRAFLK